MVVHDEDRGARRAIYVTYDGLEDPLGQSQVRPYVEGLARRGHRFEVVSFEKPGVPLRVRQPISDNILWTARRYHKRPTAPATAFDILSGAATVGARGLLHGADLLHARSLVAATMALPWAIAARVPLFFDMRGFWPDERRDSGAWPAHGSLYRAAKGVERILLRRAAVISVLTHSMQAYFRTEYPYRSEIRASIQVIPTCTDLTRFSPAVKPDASLAALFTGARVLSYVGSVGTWYMAKDMARFYMAWRAEIRQPAAADPPPTRFLLISQSQPDPVRSVLMSAGLGEELVHHSVRYGDVAAAARCSEASLSFREPTFSARGGAPTKLGEMLACGIPVAANPVGDVAAVLQGTGAGVIVDDMSDAGLTLAARRLIAVAVRPGTADEARQVAERWFHLDRAIDAYDGIYRRLRTRSRPSRLEDAGWPV